MADWVDFGKDVGGLLVDEIVYVAAVAVGDDAVAQLAIQGMVEKRGDAAASTIGVVSPVPRTGAAIKAAKAMRTTNRGPNPCSFVAGTPVMTQDGLKPIEAIREGDIVLARDEETGEQVWREVVGTLSKMHETVLVLEFEAEDGEQTQVITTDDHPFYVRGQGWTEAGKLNEGRLLETADGFVRLTGSTSVAKRQLAYDLTVDEAHTFFVGEAQVWVHNCSDSKTAREALRKAKEENGIPRSAQPDRTIKPNTPEGKKMGLDDRNVKLYEYTNSKGEKIHIRQDKPASYGAEGGRGDQRPHFNAGPAGQKLKQHHYYGE